MSLAVKICGLKTEDAVDAAVEGGAAYVGFIFFPRSPRALAPDAAAVLRKRVPPAVRTVAVVVDADDTTLDRIMREVAPDLLQLHGRESPARTAQLRRRYDRPVIKALPVATAADLRDVAIYAKEADILLFDAKPGPEASRPGGNALSFDWALMRGVKLQKPWLLAGGLTADNLAEAVATSGAAAVDVSSGVERAPGEKDVALIRRLLEVAKNMAVNA